MVECWLPYGKTEVHLSVPIRDLLGVAEPDLGQPGPNPSEVIRDSLLNPLGAKPLSDLVGSGTSIAIALDGIISPYLAAATVLTIGEQLSQAGASMENAVVVIGNGCREQSDSELLEALKDNEALKDIRVVEHTRGSMNIIEVGTTSKKTKVEINDHFAGADVRIAVGTVILDPFTGFRGSHCTVLPALSGLETMA